MTPTFLTIFFGLLAFSSGMTLPETETPTNSTANSTIPDSLKPPGLFADIFPAENNTSSNGTIPQDKPIIDPLRNTSDSSASMESGEASGHDEPCFCITLYAPVCGSDGRTYPGECDLKCAAKKNPSLIKKKDGRCEETNKDNACACPKYYSPLCGSDGKTYSNEQCFKCAQKTDSSLTKKSEGSCDHNE